MHPHGVEVLDAADHHAVIGDVAHDLELVLLPARYRLLHEDLANGRRRYPLVREPSKISFVVRDAGTGAPQDEARADDDGPSDAMRNSNRLFNLAREPRFGNRESDVGHRRLEEFTVLGRGDRIGPGTDHFDAEPVEHAATDEFHRQVECGLPAQRWKQRVGTLALEDIGEHVGVERLDVGHVGGGGVGHDGRRVRVHENDLVALGTQHLAGLCAGVVKFAGLTDHDWS